MGECISESVHLRPGGALSGLVTAMDGYRQRGVPPARHLGLPSPDLTMILTLDEPLELAERVDRSLGPGRFSTLIGGLHSRPVVITHQGAQSGVQVSVSPLASRSLFGVPAGELANLDLPADAVLGPMAVGLSERIADTTDWPSRLAVLTTALTRAATHAEPSRGPAAPVCEAWERLQGSGGMIGVAALAREVGWSERRLEQAFAVEIGMSPKRAARVIRFDRARRAIGARGRNGQDLDLARLAAEFGYADQSHLNKEFRSFTGLAPTRWLATEFGNVQGRPPADA